MKILCILTFALLGIQCNYTDGGSIILGDIKNSKISKVYLTDSYEWNKLLDSAEVVDNKFQFKRKIIDSTNTYSIYYKDSSGVFQSIEFINRVLSPDSVRYLVNYFVIDTGVIQITGDWSKYKNHYYDLISGREMKAVFRTQMMQFGYLNVDVNKRTSQLNEYLSIIKDYPNSNYLLTQINTNKSVVKKAELEAMLKLFSQKALRQTSTGQYLTTYLAKKKGTQNFQNFILEDISTKQRELYDTTAKLNMLIIWASWCGPCRQEIPLLKELNMMYTNQGLSMTSVSVDDEKALWHKALEVEKMNWKQLIVPQSKKEVFNTFFELGSIPCVLFFDGKGNLISRTIGVDTNSFEEYKRIIIQHLK